MSWSYCKGEKMGGILDEMKTRVEYLGTTRDERIVKEKLKSLQAALKDSYQGEWITLNKQKYRCLINPDRLTNNFDEKMVSIEFESKMKAGDVFYWDRTKSHWLVYLQQTTEEAYFRAQIRKCDWTLKINNCCYWVYLRGPIEQTEVWNTKKNLSFNELNYSLLVYITKTEETNEFFQREQKIKFDGHNWKVIAVDRYSVNGVLEVYLKEDYDNSMEEEMIPPIIEPVYSSQPYIEGPQVVHAFDTKLEYKVRNNQSDGTFVVNSNKVKINSVNSEKCELEILTGKSGEFELIYRADGAEDICLRVHIVSL